MTDWYPSPLPPQEGRRFLVTGATAGIGFFTAARLVGAGAQVVLAGRNAAKLELAASLIGGQVAAGSARGESGGTVETIVLDVSSLASVTEAGAALAEGERFAGVVLNAGMVHPPKRRETSVDGHELVLATNTLGHFALLGSLLPRLAAGGRVVTLGSLSTRLSTFRVDDLEQEKGYDSWRAYAQSKIAAASLAFELDRRFRAAGAPFASVVAHPGYSITGRTPRVPALIEPTRRQRFEDGLQAPFTQGKHRGAEPILHALTAADVSGGEFWGPSALVKGAPSRQRPVGVTTDPLVAAKVWAFAEQATGVRVVVPADGWA